MYFPKKIKSISSSDKVLEIGPGVTPHSRSDVFLEYKFKDEEEKIRQRSGVRADSDLNGKPLFFYDGDRFPFADNEFDYVICSHVLEHVPDPIAFIKEVFRVGKNKGYFEYPLIPYEYLYNFDTHLHFIKFDFENKVLKFIPKSETPLSYFSSLNDLFQRSLINNWDDMLITNKEFFIEGFEYGLPFQVVKSKDISSLLPQFQKNSIIGRVKDLLSINLRRAIRQMITRF